MISVIVPIYNVEKYLNRCVESILSQSYTDFELILVDDGSPDKCPELCDEWGKKDERIKVIHKENGGLSSARNAGIEMAKGDYFAFVDSDDFIHPDYLKLLYKALITSNADVAICDFFNFKEEKEVFLKDEEIENIAEFNNYNVFLPNDVFKYNQQVILEVAWNKLYSRKLFNDIRFPLGKIHEDTGTYYKLLSISTKIVFINNILYFYFKNQNGIIATEFSEKKFDSVIFCLEEIDFFKKLSQKEKKYNVLVRLSTFRCAKIFYELNLKYVEFDLQNNVLANKLKQKIKCALKKNKSIKMNYDNYELYKFYFGNGISSKTRFIVFKIKYFFKKVRVKLFGK